MLKDYPDILTVKEVAEILRIGKNMVYQMLQTNTICSRRVGRKFLIPKKCVIDYINETRYST